MWPRIIWRKNWLFGLIPAGIAVLIVLFLQFAGVETEERIELSLPPNTEGMATTGTMPVQPSGAAEFPLPPERIALVAVLVGANLFLILAMQRPKQQRIALLALLIGVSLVEIPFQIEELVFRRRIQEACDQYEAKTRNAPVDNAKQPAVTGQPRSRSNSRDGFVVEMDRAFMPRHEVLTALGYLLSHRILQQDRSGALRIHRRAAPTIEMKQQAFLAGARQLLGRARQWHLPADSLDPLFHKAAHEEP